MSEAFHLEPPGWEKPLRKDIAFSRCDEVLAAVAVVPAPVAKVEPLVCPVCGEELSVNFGKARGEWFVYHPANRTTASRSWWGKTREEAIAEFRKESR